MRREIVCLEGAGSRRDVSSKRRMGERGENSGACKLPTEKDVGVNVGSREGLAR